MTRLAAVANRYEARRSAFLTRVGQAQEAQAQAQATAAEITKAHNEATTAERVSVLFQSYSEAEQADLQGRVEALVSMGLEAVFGEPLRFRMLPGAERGQATLRFSIESEGTGPTDILEARGGGLAAIVGFVLRVVVLALDTTNPRRFLVLDESFGMVSAEYELGVSQFLRQLCDQVDLQVLLVTHAPQVGALADKVYRVRHDGNCTQVESLQAADL